jgi:hypothetical protein
LQKLPNVRSRKQSENLQRLLLRLKRRPLKPLLPKRLNKATSTMIGSKLLLRAKRM